MKRLAVVILLLCAQRIALPATLPFFLTPNEIGRVVEQVGGAATTKLLRSAEPYPFFIPGLKIGLEANFISADEVYRLGNGLGSGPGIIPLPRFYLAKSLFAGFELIGSFLPNSISSPVNTWGGILKYNWINEDDSSFSAAFFGGLTAVRGFNAIYEGTNYEGGMVLSKDFVRLRPYLGAAVLLLTGSVHPSHALVATDNGATRFMFHSFLGAELILPVTISFQLDLFNVAPKASVLIGQTF